MAKIKLSGEARRMIGRSDEPERMHLNILIAEATLRILEAHPQDLWDDEKWLGMGYDQPSIDYGRAVLAGVQQPFVRKLSLDAEERTQLKSYLEQAESEAQREVAVLKVEVDALFAAVEAVAEPRIRELSG